MTWISWSEKQITGHHGMDRDHQQLADLINQLADGMENSKSKEYCSGLLARFIDQTKTHFLAEEQLMDRHRYPHASQHKALHAMLVKDVLAFKASYDAGETVEFITLLVILDSWLNRDILGADKVLADYVAAAG